MTLPNGKPLPVVLLANKCDLPEAVVRRDMLDDFCKEHGFTAWYETSAKNNTNIEDSVRGLVAAILSHPDAFEAQRVLAANKSLAPGGVALAGAGSAGAGSDSGAAGGKGSGGGCCS